VNSVIWVMEDNRKHCYYIGIDFAKDNEQQTTKKEGTMNYSTTVFLTHAESVRAIRVSYTKDTETSKTTRYTFKTFDKSIKVGDYVAVPTSGANNRHAMTVCKVEEVDVRIELESSVQLGWIVAKFDTEDYEATLKWEEQNNIKIQNAQALKKQKQLAEDLKEAINGTFDEVKALPSLKSVNLELEQK
jgi:hypothetical protein